MIASDSTPTQQATMLAKLSKIFSTIFGMFAPIKKQPSNNKINQNSSAVQNIAKQRAKIAANNQHPQHQSMRSITAILEEHDRNQPQSDAGAAIFQAAQNPKIKFDHEALAEYLEQIFIEINQIQKIWQTFEDEKFLAHKKISLKELLIAKKKLEMDVLGLEAKRKNLELSEEEGEIISFMTAAGLKILDAIDNMLSKK